MHAVLSRYTHLYWAFGLFVGLTLVLTFPIWVHPGSTSLGSDPDVHTFAWTLAWDTHALTSRPWPIFEANIFYPYHHTLAFSENLIGNALVAGPALRLTGNAVFAMNAVALASCVLCGVGSYVLARSIGVSSVAAVICGVVFAFTPARFLRFQQIHLTTV